MRYAVILCFVLSTAAALATADPAALISDEPLNGLPMETRIVTPASAEAASLVEISPSANYLEIQKAIDKCGENIALAQRISKTDAQVHCTKRLLGP